MFPRLHERLLGQLARLTGRFLPWHRLPFPLAVLVLLGLRVNLRRRNLIDTERNPEVLKPAGHADTRDQRCADGSYNDLACPWMGMAKARFGRNMPGRANADSSDLYDPNPRAVSRRLLARKEFIPVPGLNLLAAAWLQFMVHDWLGHGPNDRSAEPLQFPRPPDDDWPVSPISVLRTRPDHLRCPADTGQPPAYRNVETHWWDGSQIYGSSHERQMLVRTDPETGIVCATGAIPLDANGLLPIERGSKIPNLELTGVNGNWWIGLSLLHTLFTREHNAIVERLRRDYPQAPGEWLFQKARLVNAALMAKIHTVAWTPALMNSPVGRFAMHGNWWGLLGERFHRVFGRIGKGEILSGIPGSRTDHHDAPYCMTEDFTAVYRMHGLLPDVFSFRSSTDDRELMTRDFTSVAAGGVREVYQKVGFEDVVYSFATSHPGALVLHNFPTSLLRLMRKDEETLVDLGAVDVLRDRERGVPRYCEFRKHLGMSVPKTFAELTSNREWQRELEEVYGSVDKVDLLVGTLAEDRPPGFGFSDTAFRIFILMASRRLKSDRFFTDHYNERIYTPAGFAWVQDNDLASVLDRHCPSLRPHHEGLDNIFFPWKTAGALKESRP